MLGHPWYLRVVDRLANNYALAVEVMQVRARGSSHALVARLVRGSPPMPSRVSTGMEGVEMVTPAVVGYASRDETGRYAEIFSER